MVFFVIILILIAVFLARQIRIVPQQTCCVIERFGKYQMTWQAGIHIKVPVIDKIVKRISLKEQVLDFPPQNVITKDNVTMSIDSVVYASVFDAEKYTYGIENPILGLQNLTATTLRSIIGSMELDQTLSSRSEINNQMQAILDEATDQWGLKVTRVEVKNINPPKEIEEVMTKQMRAERERRQTVLEAQAHRESVVSRAEGDKQAKLLAAQAERDAQIALAEGRAKAIQLVYEAEAAGLNSLSKAGLDDNVLRLKAIEAMKDVADGQATKIFIPNDLANGIGVAGVLGEAFGVSPKIKTGIPKKVLRDMEKKSSIEQQVLDDACLDGNESKETGRAAKTTAEKKFEAEMA